MTRYPSRQERYEDRCRIREAMELLANEIQRVYWRMSPVERAAALQTAKAMGRLRKTIRVD